MKHLFNIVITLGVAIKAIIIKLKTRIEYSIRQNSNRSVVTIFGSCRQDSLYERFAVTRIREELTYTHYIEETIQAVKYCKETGSKDKLGFGAFRVDLLGKKRPNKRSLNRDFRRTDVFVVEIASLLEYTNGEHFFHHEAYDSAKKNSDFLHKNKIDKNIKVNKSNLDQTFEKLDELFKLIPRDKTVLVSHITTKKGTDRSQLNETVKLYAEKHGIEYFDPSDILEIWPLELVCEIEPVISHFTKIGHEIVGDRLSQIIYRVTSRKSKEVVHKYTNGSRIGFGDFIFGSIFLKKLAAHEELPIAFDLNDHPLGRVLGLNHSRSSDTETIPICHNDSLRNFKKSGFYISNRRPKTIDAGDRDFIIRNLLKVRNPTLVSKLKSFSFNNYLGSDHIVFHARFGDQIAFSATDYGAEKSQIFENVLHSIKRILGNYGAFSNYIILSDSEEFRKFAADLGFVTSLKSVRHFNAQTSAQEDLLINMLEEFMLMASASNVIQFSVYSWGSGFSDSACMVGGGKISRFQIESTS
jgi:hypothetical protein